MSPSQRAVPCKVDPQPGKAGISLVRYTPTEEGAHAVNVSYDGHPVPGSPFPVEAQLPPDPSKVATSLWSCHSDVTQLFDRNENDFFNETTTVMLEATN